MEVYLTMVNLWSKLTLEKKVEVKAFTDENARLKGLLEEALLQIRKQ